MFDFSLLLLIFCSGCGVYILNNRHFLIMLLSLEVLVIGLFLMMFLYFSYFDFEYFFSLVYLAMSVCEGALGLSLLVMIIRTHGSDNLYVFDNLW
uniref:NADH-ubiquinone oxidoreductase chain 4L n=1 Tax=Cryphalus piceae TaxID=1586473 RepID=A0A7M4C8N4_9CUCU|nr:NADH dehydrogenase subunit 4L [Cryphalus piceae]